MQNFAIGFIAAMAFISVITLGKMSQDIMAILAILEKMAGN